MWNIWPFITGKEVNRSHTLHCSQYLGKTISIYCWPGDCSWPMSSTVRRFITSWWTKEPLHSVAPSPHPAFRLVCAALQVSKFLCSTSCWTPDEYLVYGHQDLNAKYLVAQLAVMALFPALDQIWVWTPKNNLWWQKVTWQQMQYCLVYSLFCLLKSPIQKCILAYVYNK